jgi:glycosyltransferase involved in cell wall biosynthesis
LKIIFISSDKYPDGGASPNRHMAYAKGLVESGNEVTFILLLPQNSVQPNFSLDGINFVCLSPNHTMIIDKKLKKQLTILKSVRHGRQLIKNLYKKGEIDVVILLDTYISSLSPFLRLCKKMRIKVLHERTENPLAIERKGLGRVNDLIYRRFILPKFDGIFVISKALKEYFTIITREKIPVTVINMIVDPSRFDFELTSKSDSKRYIAYCGSMEIEKDGIDILIRSFGTALEENEIPGDLNLMLIGDNTNKALMNKLYQILAESKCQDRVIFTGRISRKELPGLLVNAQALALARPDSIQAQGGFPTKLGEYLSTGKPVIITNTGEIGLFLKDGYNAFIAQPGSKESFSKKIREVFDNYPAAVQIGLRGKELIYSEFNYFKQANRLVEFIERIKNSNKN